MEKMRMELNINLRHAIAIAINAIFIVALIFLVIKMTSKKVIIGYLTFHDVKTMEIFIPFNVYKPTILIKEGDIVEKNTVVAEYNDINAIRKPCFATEEKIVDLLKQEKNLSTDTDKMQQIKYRYICDPSKEVIIQGSKNPIQDISLNNYFKQRKILYKESRDIRAELVSYKCLAKCKAVDKRKTYQLSEALKKLQERIKIINIQINDKKLEIERDRIAKLHNIQDNIQKLEEQLIKYKKIMNNNKFQSDCDNCIVRNIKQDKDYYVITLLSYPKNIQQIACHLSVQNNETKHKANLRLIQILLKGQIFKFTLQNVENDIIDNKKDLYGLVNFSTIDKEAIIAILYPNYITAKPLKVRVIL